MGEVWRARHRLLARPAAIKLIRPSLTANVMELLDGLDAEMLVRRTGPVPAEQVIHLLRQADVDAVSNRNAISRSSLAGRPGARPHWKSPGLRQRHSAPKLVGQRRDALAMTIRTARRSSLGNRVASQYS